MAIRSLPGALARLAFGLSLLLVACGSPPLAPTKANLSLSRDTVNFPRAFVGYPVIEEVRVVNASRADASFTVEALDGAFLVRPEGEQKVGGSTARTLRIQFAPTMTGPHEATLRILLGEEPVEVLVTAFAESPLSCPSTPCAKAKFDPKSGECLVEPLVDGASCVSADLCLENTTCQGGRCVGSELVCKPPNACFVSRCNPEFGCENIPRDACEQPANPCRVARCDPLRGCVEENREDYSACGIRNCTEQNICLSGACVRIDEVPDGSPCFHSCGEGGKCEGGICERPDGDELASSWELREVSEGFAAVGRAGHLYWLRCPEEGCSLVSSAPNGFERFRTELSPQLGRAGGLLLHDDQPIVWGERGLESLTAQGARRWLSSVDDLLGSGDSEDPVDAELSQVVDAGEDLLVARARLQSSSLLLGVSAADGSLRWMKGEPENSPIAADGVGKVFAIDAAPEGSELRSYDEGGQVGLAVGVPEGSRILAALPNRLLLSSEGRLEARHPTSGEVLWERPHEPLDLVLSATHAFVIEAGPGGAPRLAVLDVEEGEQKGADSKLATFEQRSTLVLRSEDRALLLGKHGEEEAKWWLEEFDDEGERTYSCQIPEESIASPWTFLPAFDGGEPHLIVRTEGGHLRSFLAPKLAPPPYGWSAEHGSFRRGGKPSQ